MTARLTNVARIESTLGLRAVSFGLTHTSRSRETQNTSQQGCVAVYETRFK
jgi:hypothetical protein